MANTEHSVRGNGVYYVTRSDIALYPLTDIIDSTPRLAVDEIETEVAIALLETALRRLKAAREVTRQERWA